MELDETKIVNGHVVWALLTAAEQADLLASFPHQANLTDGQMEKWLDGAYAQRVTITEGVATPNELEDSDDD